MHNVSPNHSSTLNTCNDFIHTYIECVTSHTRKLASRVAVRVGGGVGGEGRVVGLPKFIHGVSAPCH